MKRKDFIKKAGTLGLGAGALALIHPTNVEGGVQDNSTLNEIVGKSDISNVANTVTEAIGNEELLTNAKTLSGAVNENAENIIDIYVGNDGKLHKVKGGADTVLPFSSTDMDTIALYPSGYGATNTTQYTADKDCIFFTYVRIGKNYTPTCTANGQNVTMYWCSTPDSTSIFIALGKLKKGQTVYISGYDIEQSYISLAKF